MAEGFEKTIEYLRVSDGNHPCANWLDQRDKTARARIQAAIDKVSRGLRKLVKPLGDGVFEIKIDFARGYRIYFGEDGPKIIVLIFGGDKTSQTEDIKTAKALWRDYEKNKKL